MGEAPGREDDVSSQGHGGSVCGGSQDRPWPGGAESGGSSSLGTPSQQDGQEALLELRGLAALRALCPDPGRAPQPPLLGPQAPSH